MKSIKCQVAVLGGGPGGYTAAFRAADLGLNAAIIEQDDKLGGVCLNVGCIPSKTLLHAAQLIEEVSGAHSYGLDFGVPKINIPTLREKKETIINQLTGGLAGLAKARNVTVIHGKARINSEKTLLIENDSESKELRFNHLIIASGSSPVHLSSLPDAPEKIWDSTTALSLPFIPKHLAVLGGGIIGLEMAQIYGTLGSKITIIEMQAQIIPPADADMVKPLSDKLKKAKHRVLTSTKMNSVKLKKDSLDILVESNNSSKTITADALLVAVGRKPNTQDTGLEKIGINMDESGFIQINEKMETNIRDIFAIGDVAGNPMLAHKAAHEGKIVAEVISGMKSSFNTLAIPNVAYTEPEIAWSGYTEKQAKAAGILYKKGSFPWTGSGRALATNQSYGHSKVLFHKESGRIIGAGIVGARAGDLISEATLAIEMGADAQDIGSTIHAHPTFAETFAFSAEMVHGSITDAMPPTKKKKS